MIDREIVEAAAHYLRLREGEHIEPSGLGLWSVNGVHQSAGELVDYANDLRRIEHLSLFRPPGRGQRP